MTVTIRTEDILTTTQVAQICGVSYGTVRKWCSKGLLNFWLFKKHRRIDKAELVRFMKKHNMPIP